MPDARRIWDSVPVLALVGTLATLAVQGFAYGVSNNVFHIPLVLHDYALPQFAHDAFQQSLPRYVSPVFPALSLVATRDNLPALFLALHVAGRLLTIWAMLRVLGLCGVTGIRRLFALGILVAMPGLYGITELGRQELFPRYFTHTALAQAGLLWAVVCLAKGRFVAACLLSAVAFDINAFVGVWMAGPLAVAALTLQPRPSWRTVASGLAAGAAVALPVAAWVGAVAGTEHAGFDYAAFLRAYYPFHFFIDVASRQSVIQLAAAVLSGALAFQALAFRPGLSVGAGFVGVFLAGIAVGAVATSPLVLNLHLLRVDGPLILLAACGAVAMAVRAAGQDVFTTACGALIAIGCLIGDWTVVLLGMLAWRLPIQVRARLMAPLRPAWTRCTRRPGPAVALAACLLLLDGTALAAFKNRPPTPGATSAYLYLGNHPAIPYWREAKLWARDNTAPAAAFLVPPMLEGFETDALRQAWVDWKTGAAAMWDPGFHQVWATRIAEVSALATPAGRIRYACAHNLDYAVLDLRGTAAPGMVEGIAPSFRNPAFAIYPTRECPPGP